MVYIKERKIVSEARKTQLKRYEQFGFRTNADLRGSDLNKVILLGEDAKETLNKAADKLKLSVRGYNRVSRVARTIADLDGSEYISGCHVAEAISFRAFNFGKLSLNLINS